MRRNREAGLRALSKMKPAPPDDPHRLRRFADAQQSIYQQALGELRAGRKTGHWMWFIFPQIDGLGRSDMARTYAIKSRGEAAAYLRNEVLGPRLTECAEALLHVQGKSAHEIMGFPDDLKLQSCMTLFAHVAELGSVFHRVLGKYYGGMQDPKTLQLILAGMAPGGE